MRPIELVTVPEGVFRLPLLTFWDLTVLGCANDNGLNLPNLVSTHQLQIMSTFLAERGLKHK